MPDAGIYRGKLNDERTRLSSAAKPPARSLQREQTKMKLPTFIRLGLAGALLFLLLLSPAIHAASIRIISIIGVIVNIVTSHDISPSLNSAIL